MHTLEDCGSPSHPTSPRSGLVAILLPTPPLLQVTVLLHKVFFFYKKKGPNILSCPHRELDFAPTSCKILP